MAFVLAKGYVKNAGHLNSARSWRFVSGSVFTGLREAISYFPTTVRTVALKVAEN
jgi:hypothetical protein